MPESTIVQQIMDPPPPAPDGLHLVIGPYSLQSLVLLSLARYLCAGRRVYWIDAGNGFDAYGLGQAARAAQLDERRVLSHVQVARPFTAIQMNGMLSRQLPQIPRACPVILSDPMALFYDLEMPENDVARVFRDFIRVVRGLSLPVLALAVARKAPEQRSRLSPQLLREARTVARMAITPQERQLG